ncbi:hypothetical protein [Aeromicrobium duanguangcaii]|uniref:Uncharacterized protein n=1 Tax=Aeromicrobium duanguangcaii TaxID=2968086 RepID=A0ABY5KAE5_9ACTN|nr:hypothetical protein [Aeromicrobium duanguangcaii]MCL3837383.1 hypothetical protein [Aeromicrobium duanguangcaii]UUI67412.1 hypothetical protein NP095_09340 [Aeromicrobium duanguangcaii]
MLDDSDVRSRPLPNLGTKVAILAAIPFLAYGIYLLLTPITDIQTSSGAIFECGSALQPPADDFQEGVCGPINQQYLYRSIAAIVAAVGIAGVGAMLFGFSHHVERAVSRSETGAIGAGEDARAMSHEDTQRLREDDYYADGGARRRLLDDGR